MQSFHSNTTTGRTHLGREIYLARTNGRPLCSTTPDCALRKAGELPEKICEAVRAKRFHKALRLAKGQARPDAARQLGAIVLGKVLLCQMSQTTKLELIALYTQLFGETPDWFSGFLQSLKGSSTVADASLA